MKIKLDLPDEMGQELRQKSVASGLSLEAYVTELICQLLPEQTLGDEGNLESRPDWQAALERSRADLAAGRAVEHDEVEAWHRRQ